MITDLTSKTLQLVVQVAFSLGAVGRLIGYECCEQEDGKVVNISRKVFVPGELAGEVGELMATDKEVTVEVDRYRVMAA